MQEVPASVQVGGTEASVCAQKVDDYHYAAGGRLMVFYANVAVGEHAQYTCLPHIYRWPACAGGLAGAAKSCFFCRIYLDGRERANSVDFVD